MMSYHRFWTLQNPKEERDIIAWRQVRRETINSLKQRFSGRFISKNADRNVDAVAI